MTYRCKRCGRPIWVPESVIRGMGPICFGKSYAIKRLLTKGMTKEEIEKIPKEEIEKLAKKEVEIWKKNKKNKAKIKSQKIKIKKVNHKKDNNQKTLDSFIFNGEKEGSNMAIEQFDSATCKVGTETTDSKPDEIEELKKELNDILRVLPKSHGWKGSDRALELIGKLNKLESEK